MDDFYREKQESRMLLYGPRRSPRSVFDKFMRTYGPMNADILCAVAVNSFTPFVEGGGPLLVREVAWTLDPGFFHRSVADVVEGVRSLAKEGLVRILPEPDYCHLESRILPSEALMEEVSTYIRSVEEGAHAGDPAEVDPA